MWKRRGSPAGKIALGAGIIILLALILPDAVWWFALGVGLIALGIKISRNSWR